jgi:hypothetical protein
MTAGHTITTAASPARVQICRRRRPQVPIPERTDIAGLVCFFDERVDRITVDGVEVARPETPWSAPLAS